MKKALRELIGLKERFKLLFPDLRVHHAHVPVPNDPISGNHIGLWRTVNAQIESKIARLIHDRLRVGIA